MPFFSIIVPMYNVELYIEECLKSLFHQPFSSFELIVVDDGSTDESVLKCLALMESGHDYILLGQCQQGPNKARNLALNHATGKYVLFMDADDKLADFALEKIYSEICIRPEIDVLSFGYEFFDDDTNRVRAGACPKTRNLKSYDIFVESLIGRDFGGVCWNKCYRREFLLKNEILFVSDKIHGRDLLFSRTVALHAKEWATLAEIVYRSRYRIKSFSRSFSERNITSSIDVAEKHVDYFYDEALNRGIVPFLNYAIHRHLRYVALLSAFRASDYSEFKRYIEIIKKSSLKLFLSGRFVSMHRISFDRALSALVSVPMLCWLSARTLKFFNYEPY